jgi:hypothetical protein
MVFDCTINNKYQYTRTDHMVSYITRMALTSIADPGCLFRIPDPDFYPSRIGSRNQQQQQKCRVSDPYSFFTDPDPEDPDGGQYGSGYGSGSNPDPGL